MSMTKSVDAGFKMAENAIYLIIGLLPIATAAFLIFQTVVTLTQYTGGDEFIRWIVTSLAKILLLLMVIEILYTVRISFVEHTLYPQPFLIVGLIAAIRRVLVISVESAYLPEKFDHHMIEMGILGGLVLIFVFCLFLLNRRDREVGKVGFREG